ncbi:MAG: hypothetical protein PVH64_01045 [Bacillota bacterium]|jgi:hypothetical protein
MTIDTQIAGVIDSHTQAATEIQAKEAYQKYVTESIQSGLLQIDNLTLHFTAESLLNNAIRLYLPHEFTVMDPELAEAKYPSTRRPGLIYTDSSTTINLAFKHTPTPLVLKELAEFKQTMMRTVRKMQSAAQFLDDGIKVFNHVALGYFEFVTPALDGAIYNLAAFTPLAGRALLINCNCFEADLPQWQPIIWGMLSTLRMNPQNVKEDVMP